MPGADDKVILRIKLDIEGVSKEFKALTAEIKNLTKAMEGFSKSGMAGQAKINKEIKEGTLGIRQQGEELKKVAKAKENEAEKVRRSGRQQSQETINEAKKTEGVMRRFWRGLGIGSGANRLLDRPEGGHAQRWGQMIGSAPRAIANTALSIGSGLLGFAIGGVQTAYGQYVQAGQAMGALGGMGLYGRGSRAALGGALKASGGAGGVNLGFGPTATYGHAAMVGRATGEINAVYRAQQFALAGGGMDVGEAAGVMGQLRSAGLKFGKGEQKESAKELGRLIAAGLATGIERPRLGAYLQNIGGVAGEVGLRQMGNVDLRNITGAFGLMSAAGLNDPGRARAMVGQLDQMIRAPGGGEAGQALMLQSFGFGRPGGETSYYDALKRQDRGFTGKGGTKNLMDVFGEVNKQYGVAGAGGKTPASEEANLVLKDISGLTLDQVEELQNLFNSGKSQEEIMKRVEEIQSENAPLEKQALDATKQGFSGVVKRLAGLEAANVGIGAKAAALVEGVQDLQLKLLQQISGYFPEILKVLRTIGQLIGDMVDLAKFSSPESAKKLKEKEQKQAWSAYEEYAKKWAEKPAKTIADKIKEEEQLAQSRAAAMRTQHISQTNRPGWIRGTAGEIMQNPEGVVPGLGASPLLKYTPAGMAMKWIGGKLTQQPNQDPDEETVRGTREDIAAANQRMGGYRQFIERGKRYGVGAKFDISRHPEIDLMVKRGEIDEAERALQGVAASGKLGSKAKKQALDERAAEAKEREKERKEREQREKESLGPTEGHSPGASLMIYDPTDARRMVGGFYTSGQSGGATTSGSSPTGLG